MAAKPITREAHAKIEQAGGEEFIFMRVAAGHTLKALAEELGVSRPILSQWCNKAQRRDRYGRAKQEAAASLVEDGLKIVDGASPLDVQVAKLRSDYRKFLAAKMNPADWGEEKGAQLQVNIGELHLQAVKTLNAGEERTTIEQPQESALPPAEAGEEDSGGWLS